MPIADWSDLMPHIVGYRPVASHDDYGKPAYVGAVTNYTARVRYQTKIVKSRVNGEDVVTIGHFWIAGIIANVSADDEFTLPDGTIASVVSWDKVPDEYGDHHMKCYFY